VIAGRSPDFGFLYNEARDSYVVHEPRMATVRRIIKMFGDEGYSLYGLKAVLNASNVPTPGKAVCKGAYWTRPFIRGCVFDVFKPHTFEEVAALVSPQVAARLDPDRLYGIWWYNRREVQRTLSPRG
jgi:hypothetical protein